MLFVYPYPIKILSYSERDLVIPSRNVVKCCCGKICKGARGLKMHQRSCRVVHGLDTELYADIEEQSNVDTPIIPENDQSTENEALMVNDQNIPNLKRGIKLSTSDAEWSTANDYFKFALQSNQPIASQDLDTNINLLNNIVYDYFAQNFGYTDSPPDNSLINRYKDYTVKDLKKALKTLKSSNGDPDEIKYVSHILRAKLRPKRNQSSESCPDNSHSNTQILNHDKYIGKNFWGYVKNILNKKDCALPSFNMTQCFSYFTNKTLAAVHPNKLFKIPSWIQPRKPGSLYLRGLRLRPWFRLVTWDFMNLLPKGERGKYQITCFHIKTLHFICKEWDIMYYFI